MLLVWDIFRLRKCAIDSGDRNWSELPLREADKEPRVPSDATRPLSAVVGRRERGPLPAISGDDGEYMLMSPSCVTDKSFISLK